jgi:hypothetical protein
MKSELEATGLIILLLALTLALGLNFGGSAISGTSSNPGSHSNLGFLQTGENRGPMYIPPRFVVRAEGINPVDLYASSIYSSVPSYMLVPLKGLRVTLTEQSNPGILNRERTRTLTLTTNSSGIATDFVSPGNYTVLITGTNFEVNATLSFAVNSTTTFNFNLHPSAKVVTVLRIVSPDSVSGVEPETKLYALLNTTSAPATGFAELVGFKTNYSGVENRGLVVVNATLQGWYAGTQGLWVVLSPSTSDPTYPSMGILLFQYKPISEVNYTAG